MFCISRRVMPRGPARIACLLTCAWLASTASAQYKWVGPDGSVTYGDRPPIAEVTAKRVTGTNSAATDGLANLPYALRSATQKFPVMLYTTSDCKPCEQSRAHLNKRGVPFSEKSIKSQADLKAMEADGFSDPSFPLVTVGRQKQTGFDAEAIDVLLDAAGYPKNSMLPKDFKSGGETAAAAAKADAAKSAAARTDGTVGKGQSTGQSLGQTSVQTAAGDQAAQASETPRQAARRRQLEASAAAQANQAPSTRTENNPNGLRF